MQAGKQNKDGQRKDALGLSADNLVSDKEYGPERCHLAVVDLEACCDHYVDHVLITQISFLTH